MQTKAQTMAQKFGFMDPDLTTPKHDTIMLWLDGELEKKAATKTYRNHPSHNWGWDDSESALHAGLPQLLQDGKLIVPLETPIQILRRKVWEVPILDRTYTIGFADMLAHYEDRCLSTSATIKALASANQDQPVEVKTSHYNIRRRYFEVKPSITSLGEVIRQIRMYQTYTAREGNVEWWIVSPDTRFRAQIEAQGIKFLEVPASI